MNSYFASVEQQANPELRDKPLGVCAYLSPNGCIIASSIEAKAIGIKTGFRVRDALKIYPKINLIENEPAKYRSVTEQIFSIFADYTDTIEPYSIDEAFLDLTGWAKNLKEAKAIALTINRRIKQEVGEWLKCSNGISTTRWLAKFASDITNSNSLLIIKQGQIDAALRNRKLTDAWGINTRIAWRLNQLGIFNLLQLKQYPVANLMQALGLYGYYLWANVNGQELTGVTADTKIQPKSIGHSYCVNKHTTDSNYHHQVLLKLCEKTGRRLRAKNLEAKRFSIYWSYVEGGAYSTQIKVNDTLFTTESIYRLALKIFEQHKILRKVRMMAVSVSALQPISGQLNIFSDILKPKQVALACDDINDRYDEYTVFFGEMLNSDKIVRDRIGYRKTLDIRSVTDDNQYI